MFTRPFNMKHYGLITIVSSLLLSACADQSTPLTPELAAPHSNSKAAQNLDQAATGRTKKPQPSPITISHKTLEVAAIGEPLTVTLVLGSTSEQGTFELHYRSSAPQQLSLGTDQPETVSFNVDTAGNYPPQTVTVLPYENGRFYLQVSAGLQTQNGLLMRPYSIPIQVGPKEPKLVTQKANAPDDTEQGISIPARMD